MLSRLFFIVLITSIVVGSCSNRPRRYRYKHDHAPNYHEKHFSIKDAEPKIEPKSRYGNPSKYKVFNCTYRVLNSSNGFREIGYASWYGKKFHGYRTSSGEIYDMYSMTAAHKSLPLPTYVLVRNLSNNAQAIVKVNDRGPFHGDRVIDLSYAAAFKLGVLGRGTAKVEIIAINPMDWQRSKQKTFSNDGQTIVATHKQRFFLQLGIFKDKHNAMNLNKKIPQHISSYVEKVYKAHTSQYRVKVGPFMDKIQVEKARQSLMALQLPVGFIIN